MLRSATRASASSPRGRGRARARARARAALGAWERRAYRARNGRSRSSSSSQHVSTGGALWFPDLTAADPYYILPVSCGATFYFMASLDPSGAPIDDADATGRWCSTRCPGCAVKLFGTTQWSGSWNASAEGIAGCVCAVVGDGVVLQGSMQVHLSAANACYHVAGRGRAAFVGYGSLSAGGGRRHLAPLRRPVLP
mgnify:CR=1 FL=1